MEQFFFLQIVKFNLVHIIYGSYNYFNKLCSYVKTARDVVTVLLRFAKCLSLYLHIFTCTYRGTHTQAQMYNQHTRGMATTRHRSLVERGGRKALLEALHTQKPKIIINVRKNPIFTNLKKRFEHRASSKATRHQVDLSYMICIQSFMVLCPHLSTLSSPLPIRCDKISRKGQVFRSFVLFGFMRKLFEV